MDVLIGVVVGAVLTAALGEWRARNEAGRRRDELKAERLATLHLERIREARRSLSQQLLWLEAAAVGNADRIGWLEKTLVPWEGPNLGLLGDGDLARDYQQILVELTGRVGTGLSADEVKRLGVLQARVAGAPDAQEERAAMGEQLAEIPDDVQREIFGSEVIERLKVPGRPPTIAGRTANVWLRLTNRFRH